MSIFQTVLGTSFEKLPIAVQETHLTQTKLELAGRGSVERGHGLIPWLICTTFGFPKTAEDIAVNVSKTVTPKGETWVRSFGAKHFQSHLRIVKGRMTERFGALTFTLGLNVDHGALHYPVSAARMGPIPLPRWLFPTSKAREYAARDTFHFDVALYAPITGQLIICYKGWLKPCLNPPSPEPHKTLPFQPRTEQPLRTYS